MWFAKILSVVNTFETHRRARPHTHTHIHILTLSFSDICPCPSRHTSTSVFVFRLVLVLAFFCLGILEGIYSAYSRPCVEQHQAPWRLPRPGSRFIWQWDLTRMPCAWQGRWWMLPRKLGTKFGKRHLGCSWSTRATRLTKLSTPAEADNRWQDTRCRVVEPFRMPDYFWSF